MNDFLSQISPLGDQDVPEEAWHGRARGEEDEGRIL